MGYFFLCLQLAVYNQPDGPCLRCLFPTPPPAHTVSNCSDGGVLGVGKFNKVMYNSEL